MKNEFENEVAEVNEATEELKNEVANVNKATKNEGEPDFQPMFIGTSNKRGQLLAEEAYEHLIELLDELKTETEKAIFRENKNQLFLEPGELFEFINNQYPDKYILRKYIQVNEINYHDFDTETIIQLGLVKIEKSSLLSLLNIRSRILKQMEIIKKTGFYYPVKNLFQVETGNFEFNSNFYQEAEKRFCRVTQSQPQNEVVTLLNELCEVLNKLNRKSILRAKNGPTEFNLLSDWVEVANDQPDDPFVVKDNLFYTHRLFNYRVKGVQSRNPVNPDQILV